MHFPSQREAHSCAGSISTPLLGFVLCFLGGWVVCCWLFFLSFIKGEKKSSQKDTSGRKTTDMHYGEPSNPGKNYHRETNRGSRSKKKTLSKPAKTHHSHSWSCVSAPLTRLGASLTTSPLGTAACAREAAELRKAPRRLLAKHREGIRASGSYAEGKCSLNRDAFFNSSRH